MARREVSEQAFFVLAAVATEPLHGYAVLSRVDELSAGRVRLAVGTLYGILDRLAVDHLIELDHEEAVDSRLRRYYRLSEGGRQTLRVEAARQRANAHMADSQLAKPARHPPRGAL